MHSSPRKRIVTLIAALASAASISLVAATPASADAQTCIATPGGTACTIVYGSGTRVDAVGVSRIKVAPFSGSISGICDYSAWFFAAPPNGAPVQSLGTENRAGCGIARVWLIKQVHQNFPPGTQLCAKFYENHWQSYVTEKCVGISA